MSGAISQIVVFLLIFSCGCTKYDRLKMKAKMGNRRAMYELGVDIWKNTSGRQDEIDKAIYWITKAAENGEVDAMYEIGSIHEMGGGPKPKAIFWYRKGAEAGDRFCMIKLAKAYEYGYLGLPKDRTEAAKWFEAARRAKKPGEM